MLGDITILDQEGLTSLPQKAASAWSVMNDIVGANYKPLVYVGTQQVKGTNHWFIAEQTILNATLDKYIVYLAINEFNDSYNLIPHTITRIEFML